MNQEDYNSIVMKVLDKGRSHGAVALNEHERIVYLVAELDTLMTMEGIFGFYACLSAHAHTVVDALETITAQYSAELIRRANELFPGGIPPSDPTALDAALDRIQESKLDTVNDIESRFLARPDCLDDKLRTFVDENRQSIEA